MLLVYYLSEVFKERLELISAKKCGGGGFGSYAISKSGSIQHREYASVLPDSPSHSYNPTTLVQPSYNPITLAQPSYNPITLAQPSSNLSLALIL